MKADSTVRKHLQALRRLINDPSTDLVTRQVAYEWEFAIRWAREDVSWPPPTRMAVTAAKFLRDELKRGSA